MPGGLAYGETSRHRVGECSLMSTYLNGLTLFPIPIPMIDYGCRILKWKYRFRFQVKAD